ncbi:sugar kinase [Pontibacter sp. JH31]|uniref:Sugar kinase n=1 Tax=Pontibacter aquaedesilientis TaxID=2766980 RepID=A0ABR7XBV9_9BACT|nr:sugar kinase [Pontibacter aquaedesilientis]MBD1395792.1 sugar kinase [Pontibacter aquaedesilientis]
MKKVACFGEVMMRLSTPGHQMFGQARQFNACYGGAEANVAISLATFGVPASFITRVPANDLGECVWQELRRYGVVTQGVYTGGDRLGLYFLESGAGFRSSKVIYDRSHSSFAELTLGMIDWEAHLAGHEWFHWSGISPAVSQSAAAVCLEGVKMAKKLGLQISCDLNYRSKLWQYTDSPEEIMTELLARTDVVLANPDDVWHYFGIKAEGYDIDDPAYNEAVLQLLVQKFPNIKTAVTTLRRTVNASHNTWAALMLQHDESLVSQTYDLNPIIDRVGGGDSFMAGLIYGLIKHSDDLQYALEFAVAASALKHSIEGDANLVKVADVAKLLEGGSVAARVSR